MRKIFFIIPIILLTIYIIYIFLNKDTECFSKIENNIESEQENIENTTVNINKYIVYGTHLNLYGDINLEEYINIDSIQLVLKNKENLNDIEYDLNYTLDENILEFYTSEKINEGVDLENLSLGNYIVILKINSVQADSSLKEKLYLLKNNTDYENLQYYTVTKNNKNNLINITFEEQINKNNTKYMNIKVEETLLPEDIYDIVIDPGHGGEDSGAITDDSSYTEADLTLKYALTLKKELENLGLKVKLTRSDDTYIKSYGENGRYVLPNEVSAKYLFSLHFNSSEYTMKTGGLEIYTESNLNTDLASLISQNIIKYTSSTYSPKTLYKVLDGVYARNFTYDEITTASSDAKLLEYESYNITDDTSYFGVIRETGGIATNAYMDGRNTDYGINKYYNSNIGVESYLIEFGYLTCSTDLNNILYKKSEYINAIAASITSYLK